jgi:hypothetical protein
MCQVCTNSKRDQSWRGKYILLIRKKEVIKNGKKTCLFFPKKRWLE